MDDDGPFGVAHAGGELCHRKIRCRAPQQDVGIDHRLDVAIAARFRLGVLDDGFHDRCAWRQRRVEVVVCGDPAHNLRAGHERHAN